MNETRNGDDTNRHGMNADQTAEEALAAKISGATYDSVSEELSQVVTRAFVDTVGVMLAGTASDGSQILKETVERGALVGDSSPVVDRLSATSVPEAALAFGTASHALDYDDLSWGIDGHPSVTLVPPLLALALREDISGREAITAYVVGYEIERAIAAPVSLDHYEQGWHATSTFGTFGAAAATASALDLTTAEAGTALNIAASMPAGTKQNFGSMTKPLHAGHAAQSGVRTALLAANGYSAGTVAISGNKGFWDLYGGGGEDPSADIQSALAGEWALLDHGVHTKKYPCCYFTHSAIAATQSLVADHDIFVEDVVTIRAGVAGGAKDALSYTDPSTPLEAKFSMQHALAVAVTGGRLDLGAFTPETLSSPEIRSLYDRIELAVDESIAYDSHAATVEIETTQGSVTETREHPPWVHSDPPDKDARRQKFRDCATRAIDRQRVGQTYEKLESLPETSLGAILATLDDPAKNNE